MRSTLRGVEQGVCSGYPLRDPVIIGREAQVVDARTGPVTAIGDGVQIRRSRVEHSVILEHSRIEDVARLEDSLPGNCVFVHPGRNRHGELSLVVGDDSVVELAKK